MSEAPSTRPTYGFRFDNSYLKLPDLFYSRENPVAVSSLATVVFNNRLAAELDLDSKVLEADSAALFSGNQKLVGSEPLAQAYAGHQFGNLSMLGDGRAILLGEHLKKNGERFDVQLKGSGPTVYSRRGDGRAALGPMLREYIVSEAMHALGVPTTRSLAVVSTGEPVFREDTLPGAVLTRVASSHIRVGTFEYAYHYGLAHQKPELVKLLADYTINRHYPELKGDENSPLSFLRHFTDRQASLVAKWMSLGFIHGVMNTDNMSVSGETIDYGPCAFMDGFSPDKVFSSIDQGGRYAYINQPSIAQWNTARLAECLLPLPESIQEVLFYFSTQFFAHWLRAMRNKLGLYNEEDTDHALIQSLLNAMQKSGADFTQTFRNLSNDSAPGEWHPRWKARLSRQPQGWHEVQALMRRSNPAIIPRNHRIEEVIRAAYAEADYSPLYKLVIALAQPYEDDLAHLEYTQPPTEAEQVRATFCGT